MLFSNVTDLREIENDFDFLSDEQIAAIRSFWSSFYPRGDTPNQLQFLAGWQVLYDLYEEFRATLAAEGKGYEGMIFREVVESMERRVSGFTLRANCLCRFERLVRIGRTFLSPVAEAEDRGFLLGLCIR